MGDSKRDRTHGPLSFDLTNRPWIPVLRQDGTQGEMSLREVFAHAGSLRQVIGDVPTQDFALLRLLLALAHDALRGPADIDAWTGLWADADCFAPLEPYLDAHQERFDLLHPVTPFFQVPELRTIRGNIASLNRIVADVPNGQPFFSARMPSVERLSFAEAARWVVHTHAYDTSGIKTGVAGDDRVKDGKVYPLGVGWAGSLGGIFVEGGTLRETLLLNLVAANEGGLERPARDLPAWRREPSGPGAGPVRQPSGRCDLYTWQTRRLRLDYDVSGVTGVVLGYGDPLAPRNLHACEPMTAWRRSEVQEKKLGQVPVYLPLEHDPGRTLWQGLSSLMMDRPGAAAGSEAASRMRPGVLEWVSRLVTSGVLPHHFQIRARAVTAVYGTQQSVIDEIIDDDLSISAGLLHQQNRALAEQATGAVTDAKNAVNVFSDFAADLTRTTGADGEAARAQARDLGFSAVDAPFRVWLSRLADTEDADRDRDWWRQELYRLFSHLGDQMLAAAGDAEWKGRITATAKGTVWLNSAYVDGWFRYRLTAALSSPSSSNSSASKAPTGSGAEEALS
ncbi:type I-E CRISPR-associated protein Cse1/CasA [Streptomyces sp. NBC_00568]|uniref:type I-E CRISPR-associated protein Cse1/CasA n=1 Tax=Streptomyces sp. NBC_00568 TaxID=2975779 RepID=UPI00225B6D4B|nr:type I-E CRISPR-associated protein Cse1/CasA [Streptomyces sp. NBC_00568]MCX4993525.1 type I-E CRISPR-associated protein Cse1/CasA [Streptomyces sp. NBC_00568]